MNRHSPCHVSLLWLLPLLILIVVLLFHTQYGFCQCDEPFYISTAKRLSQGDRLIVDEWHPTQFYAPLLVPFYRLHRVFADGDTGVLLFFRRLFIVFQGSVSVAFFFALRKTIHPAGALLLSVLCLMYSRANIAGFSYYNLSMLFMLLFWILLSLNSVPAAVFAGFSVSASVLCQPWLAPFSVALLTVLIIRKGTRRLAFAATLAVFFSAMAYLIMLLYHSSITNILNDVWYVIEDPQHLQTLSQKKEIVLLVLWQTLPKPLLVIIAVICLVLFIVRLYRIPLNTSALWWSQLLLAVTAVVKPLCHLSTIPCYAFAVPLSAALVPTLLFALLNYRYRRALLLACQGFSLMAAFFLGSNTGLDAMTAGACLVYIAGLIILFRSIPKKSGKMASVFLFSLCVVLLLTTSTQRFLGIYRDAPIEQLTVRLEEGPAKGLLTSEENARQYNDILDVITRLEASYPEDMVMHSLRAPWAYLCADWRCAAPSTWSIPIGSDRLTDYIHQHDGRGPDLVFVYAPTVGKCLSAPFNNHKELPAPNTQELSGPFWEALQTSKVVHSDPYVTVYRLKP